MGVYKIPELTQRDIHIHQGGDLMDEVCGMRAKQVTTEYAAIRRHNHLAETICFTHADCLPV